MNLLTPDRYEFYTFDESGELVKRLMTLEEIQAIVAAGEETEGLVTFANDNQPTIAFNFTQPSQTKVHSVVTNVQNVLKAQMEAQKNKPNLNPTLDTPDVSDSWSLILPSIFGNTGVDIVPDKTSGSFITPETETFEIENSNEYKHSQTKENENEIPTIPTPQHSDNVNMIPTRKTENTLSTTVSTTKNITPISFTTSKPTSMTEKVYSSSTSTTKKPEIKVTTKFTTSKPHENNSPTTVRTTSTTTKISPESFSNLNSNKPNKMQDNINNNSNKNAYNLTQISEISTTTTREPIKYEKISTISPSSSSVSITEKTTKQPLVTTKKSNSDEKLSATTDATTTSTTTSSFEPLNKNEEYEKSNATTLTTQSVSPSETLPSTENLVDSDKNNQTMISADKNDQDKENQPMIPMFDVAQSISQIASDLGNNYIPVPTSNSLVDRTKTTELAIESKENVEIDIPTESNANEVTINTTLKPYNFVKISTFDPQEQLNNKTSVSKDVPKDPNYTIATSSPISTSTTTSSTSSNIMDAVISESMGDLLSQVVRDGPDSTSIIISENNTETAEVMTTTQIPIHSYVKQDTTSTKQEYLSTTVPSHSHSGYINKTDIIDKSVTKNNVLTSTVIKNDINEIKVETSTLKETTKSEDIKNSSLFNITNEITDSKKSEPNTTVIVNNQSFSNDLNSSSNPINTATTSTEVNNYISANDTTKSSLTDKISSYDSNEIGNKQKVKEELPKIDDFKKKIQKVNIDDKELANERNSSWKLIPSLNPSKPELGKDKHKTEGFYTPETNENKNIVLEFPKENQGLEVTTKDLGDDILQFTELCNELAFRYWNVMVDSVDKKRSIVFSPYSITSMLAMMFMGAKGGTSGEMNEILKLDDMVTFNPHFTLKNISDSIEPSSSSGVVVSAFVRELFSERNKGKLLTFYKERAQHFYNGHVEEVNFKLISDVIRRRTNLLVKRHSWGKIPEYLKSNSITMSPPLAAFSANLYYVSFDFNITLFYLTIE